LSDMVALWAYFKLNIRRPNMRPRFFFRSPTLPWVHDSLHGATYFWLSDP